MYLQDIILTLQQFWSSKGCILLQPYDIEVGAGTSHPATSLRCLDKKNWNIAYVQPCRRPSDGRYAQNPNRMQHYYQFQVILKPSPINIQDLCLESLAKLGIGSKVHDLRFVESDWENPTLGAWGLGWELWCDGMEVTQFTYMQQLGGIECSSIPGEITYGIERIAMYIQNVKSVWDIKWNETITYSDVFMETEKQYCEYNFHKANTTMLANQFKELIAAVKELLSDQLVQPAYDYCLKASHLFNILEARGVLSVPERTAYISEVRSAVRKCCKIWADLHQ